MFEKKAGGGSSAKGLPHGKGLDIVLLKKTLGRSVSCRARSYQGQQRSRPASDGQYWSGALPLLGKPTDFINRSGVLPIQAGNCVKSAR